MPPPEGLHGRSLWPLIEGAAGSREYAFSGRFSRSLEAATRGGAGSSHDAAQFDGWAGGDQVGEPLAVTTEEWSLVCPPGVDGRELYHLPTDPGQQANVIAAHPEVARLYPVTLRTLLAAEDPVGPVYLGDAD